MGKISKTPSSHNKTEINNSINLNRTQRIVFDSQLKKMILNFNEMMVWRIKSLFDGFTLNLSQVDEFSSSVLPYLYQAGFVLSPNTPISLMSEIRKAANEDTATPEKVCKLLIDISEMEGHIFLRDMIDSWKSEPYFLCRTEILNDALDAHINGKYSLTIPALIPLIEGYFDSFFVEHNNRSLIIRMKEYFELIDNIDENIVGSFLSIVNTYLFHSAHFSNEIDGLNYRNFKMSFSMPPDQILNRHGILHGFDYQYSSKENSLRIILLIDSLIYLMKNPSY